MCNAVSDLICHGFDTFNLKKTETQIFTDSNKPNISRVLPLWAKQICRGEQSARKSRCTVQSTLSRAVFFPNKANKLGGQNNKKKTQKITSYTTQQNIIQQVYILVYMKIVRLGSELHICIVGVVIPLYAPCVQTRRQCDRDMSRKEQCCQHDFSKIFSKQILYKIQVHLCTTKLKHLFYKNKIINQNVFCF